VGSEFDRQVQNFLDKGYPALAGLDEEAFVAVLEPLRELAVEPFVLVVTRELVPVEDAVPLLTIGGRPGIVDRHYAPGDLARFVPPEPLPPAYLLFGVERGEEFCGAVPDDAMAAIAARDRITLTIEEGIALVLHHPETLEKNKCFSLGASRCGDRRVPALWISARAPKLGWCWAGNPHTWLGMASASRRVGPLRR
jgi:hypothetical protein